MENTLIYTPTDGRFVMKEMARYLKGHLSFLISTKRLTPTSANALYLAYSDLWKMAELMEETNTEAAFFVEHLEYVKAQQATEKKELERLIESAD